MRPAQTQGLPRTSFFWRCVIALSAVVLAVLVALPVAGRLDPIVGDLWMLRHAPPASSTHDKIVVITITEETLAAFPYRSPIDRGFLAVLVSTLGAARPAAIGLDVLLDSPSEPDKDQRLLLAIDNTPSPIVLAGAPSGFLTSKQSDYLAEVLRDRTPGTVILQQDDADGILRHLPLRGQNQPLFSEALAGQRFPETVFDSRILYQASTSGKDRPFTKYPAHAVRHLPADWFSGKYVLIGTDIPGIDQHPTPLVSASGAAAGNMPGIEVHAHVLAQLLSGRTLPVPSFLQSVILLILFAAASALVFSLSTRPKLFFAGFVAAMALYVALAWGLFQADLFLLPILSPITAACICAFLLAISKWRQDRMERAFVVSAFEKYVSPEVVRRLSSGEVELTLGGEKRLVTYVFTDLAGFTSLSEKLPPEQVAKILNGYLDEVCDIVFRHGATLDKLIGDAVACFFGAPEEDPDQANRAIQLVMELDQTAERYRAAIEEMGISLGVTRIGVHSGDAVIGNFGGQRFFDYTGIGDTVNTAARLEGANKYLGSRICISQSVVDRMSNPPAAAFRPIGDLVLKGRQQALSCFEPADHKLAQKPWFKDYLAAYDLLKTDPAGAKRLFEKVLQNKPADGLALLHLERLEKGQRGTEIVLADK